MSEANNLKNSLRYGTDTVAFPTLLLCTGGVMAKLPGPWYWQARNAWYVIVNGKRVQLSLHPADAKAPKRSRKTGRWNPPRVIFDAFHELMTKGPQPTEDAS